MKIRTVLLEMKVGFLFFLIKQTVLYAIVRFYLMGYFLQLNHTHLTNLNKAFRFLSFNFTWYKCQSLKKKKLRIFRFKKLKLNVWNIFNDKSNHEKLLWHCKANRNTTQKFLWVSHIKSLGIAEKNRSAQTGRHFICHHS